MKNSKFIILVVLLILLFSQVVEAKTVLLKINANKDGAVVYVDGINKGKLKKNEIKIALSTNKLPAEYNLKIEKKIKNDYHYYYEDTIRYEDKRFKEITINLKKSRTEKYYKKQAIKKSDPSIYTKNYGEGQYLAEIKRKIKNKTNAKIQHHRGVINFQFSKGILTGDQLKDYELNSKEIRCDFYPYISSLELESSSDEINSYSAIKMSVYRDLSKFKQLSLGLGGGISKIDSNFIENNYNAFAGVSVATFYKSFTFSYKYEHSLFKEENWQTHKFYVGANISFFYDLGRIILLPQERW